MRTGQFNEQYKWNKEEENRLCSKMAMRDKADHAGMLEADERVVGKVFLEITVTRQGQGGDPHLTRRETISGRRPYLISCISSLRFGNR